MDNEKLAARTREGRGSRAARRLRREGEVPANLSGLGEDPVSLAVPVADISRVLRTGAQLVSLDYGEGEVEALIRGVQYDALGERVLHVDLDRIKRGERIEVDIPIKFFGEPVGATEGGLLQTHVNSITVTCLPRSIPDQIEVDIREMVIGDEIRVADLPLPEEVTVEEDARDDLVAQLIAPTAEEEEPEAEAEAAEPEVIGAGEEEAEEES